MTCDRCGRQWAPGHTSTTWFMRCKRCPESGFVERTFVEQNIAVRMVAESASDDDA